MVVMLIMSIILAAMAPVMTTRSKADSSSPWRYSPENLSDAFFGSGESQVAMIGQPNKLETDDPARLIINSSASLPVHLSFKRGDTILGRLQFSDTNVLLGSGNFDHLNGGSNNISIGPNNLTQLTSGGSNIAIGDSALSSNTSGTSNIGIGTTLSSNTDGNNNVAVGDDSLTKSNGSWNVAVGKNAYQNGTGGSNTIIGGDSMSQGSGNNNVAVGTNALWYGTGDGNVAIGANSNYKNKSLTTFSNTTAVGFSSYAGNNGTAIGHEAYADSDSTAIGNQAQANYSGSLAIGEGTSTNNAGAISIGSDTEANGESSIAIGSIGTAGATTAQGGASIAIGDGTQALGFSSITLGTSARSSVDTAIAIGNGASVDTLSGNSVSSNKDSIAIGTNAQVAMAYCHFGTCSYGGSVVIGSNAYSESSDTVAIGNSATTTSVRSVAVGYKAKATGESVAIGYNACSNATGRNKTCIGASSGPSYNSSLATSNDKTMFLGDSSTVVYIPGNLVVGKRAFIGSQLGDSGQGKRNCLFYNSERGWHGVFGYSKSGDRDSWGVDMNTLEHGKVWSDLSGVGFPLGNYISSDRRLKYVGKEFTSGLEKIRKLQVFNYTFKKDEKKTPHVGVIAQDLQKIFPDAVKKGTDGFLSIRFEDMFFAMINAIKELDLKYEAQEKRINDLEAQLKQQNARLKVLESRIK